MVIQQSRVKPERDIYLMAHNAELSVLIDFLTSLKKENIYVANGRLANRYFGDQVMVSSLTWCHIAVFKM